MASFNKVRILSRKSDLAIIQAKEIGNILQKKNTNLKIEYILKSTSGDKDLNTPLSPEVDFKIYSIFKIYFWRQRFKHPFI